MARSRRKLKARPPLPLDIESLSHDGRGIGQHEGKKIFVSGALPGEQVMAKIVRKRSRFDEAELEQLVTASQQRVEPQCQHASICGGCSLQHLQSDAQIAFKQKVVLEQLQHFGGLVPEHVLPATQAGTQHYRRKARLGVRFVTKKDQVLVGFREKGSNFIADLKHCPVLDPRVGEKLLLLRSLIASLETFRTVPQIEVAMGDEQVALVLRHLESLPQADIERLKDFAKTESIELYLQPAGVPSVHKLWPQEGLDRLRYRLPEFDLEMHFHPMDFTQVNPDINKKIVHRAMQLLAPQNGERVLDLFCGLGNFTLPIARSGANVVGVEGSRLMVERGYENARLNGLNNVEFYVADLTQDFTHTAWAANAFDKLLIDPPRSGALQIVQNISRFKPSRIVYVSCNPATLARDAGELVERGYRLSSVGVFDMFPHTTHVESIAMFERAC